MTNSSNEDKKSYVYVGEGGGSGGGEGLGGMLGQGLLTLCITFMPRVNRSFISFA